MGVLNRLILREAQWERISRYVTKDGRVGGSWGRDNRMFVEAVLRIARTGALPRPAGRVRLLEHRLGAVQPMSAKGVRHRIFAGVSNASPSNT